MKKKIGQVSEAPLHLKYRPKTWDEVIGQDAVVQSLKASVSKESAPHSFLFTGPSGVGKTTLARILANELRCTEQDLIEIDAARYSGVDEMRDVVSMAQYRGFGGEGVRVVIVDECHRLSRQTWDTLLKIIEEPPPHLYWCLCTTEASKVPRTIVTRCHAYELRSVHAGLLFDYLEIIRDEERMSTGDDVLKYVADKAEGSVRQALVFLSAARDCANRKEAHELLAQAADNPELIDLARRLADGRGLTWQFACGVVKNLEQSPEGARMVIVNYLGAALSGTTDERKAARMLTVLECFAEPYRDGEKLAPLWLSLGRAIFK